MFLYARSVDTEIAGFGEVELLHGRYYITDTYIFPQKASGGYVELDGEALTNWMRDCAKKGQHERVAKSRLWWHSHVNMSCFRSVTDNDTVERLLTSMPYVISCVVNKQFQYELSLHLKEPVRVTFNHVNPMVDRFDTSLAEIDCAKEAKEMVRDSAPVQDKIDWSTLKEPAYNDGKKFGWGDDGKWGVVEQNNKGTWGWTDKDIASYNKKYNIPEPKPGTNVVWTKEDVDRWREKHGWKPCPKPPKEIVSDPWDRYAKTERDNISGDLWQDGGIV